MVFRNRCFFIRGLVQIIGSSLDKKKSALLLNTIQMDEFELVYTLKLPVYQYKHAEFRYFK
jgi:hypothetical protein